MTITQWIVSGVILLILVDLEMRVSGVSKNNTRLHGLLKRELDDLNNEFKEFKNRFAKKDSSGPF